MDDTAVDIPAITAPPPIPHGVVHWYGKATRSWWAMLAGCRGWFLVEAVSEEQLAAMIHRDLRRI